MKQRLYRVFSAVMNIPVEKITDDMSPKNFDKWDSLSHINLITAVEEEFDIMFDEDQVIEATNLPFLLGLIEKIAR